MSIQKTEANTKPQEKHYSHTPSVPPPLGMLTAFGHLEGLSLAETSRNAHDDEYSDDDATFTLPSPASLEWQIAMKSPVASTQELFIATELAGSSFLTCNFPNFQQVATLSTENGMALSLLAAPSEAAAGTGFTKIIVTGTFIGAEKFIITAGDEWRWVEPLFAGLTANQIIVLDTVLATTVPLVSAAQGKPSAPFIFQLGTTEFVKSNRAMNNGTIVLTAPILPNPILMEGLSGAVMAHCEAVGMNAISLISLVERVIDSSTLVAYETWVELEHKDDETATKQRKEMYKKAVKHASRQLDALYL